MSMATQEPHLRSHAIEDYAKAIYVLETRGPHGDPIPSAEFEIHEQETRSLADLEPGDEGVFVRVSDSDSDMLRYLGDRGVTPGSSFEVVERQPFGGPLFVRFGRDVH